MPPALKANQPICLRAAAHAAASPVLTAGPYLGKQPSSASHVRRQHVGQWWATLHKAWIGCTSKCCCCHCMIHQGPYRHLGEYPMREGQGRCDGSHPWSGIWRRLCGQVWLYCLAFALACTNRHISQSPASGPVSLATLQVYSVSHDAHIVGKACQAQFAG